MSTQEVTAQEKEKETKQKNGRRILGCIKRIMLRWPKGIVFPLSLLVLEKMRDIHHRKCEQRGGASECV